MAAPRPALPPMAPMAGSKPGASGRFLGGVGSLARTLSLKAAGAGLLRSSIDHDVRERNLPFRSASQFPRVFRLGHDAVQCRSSRGYDDTIRNQVRIKNCGESIACMGCLCIQAVHQTYRN
jgi:hypothetical protein